MASYSIMEEELILHDDSEGNGVIDQICRSCGKEIFVRKYTSYAICDECNPKVTNKI